MSKLRELIGDDRLPWFHCFPGKLLNAIAGMSSDQQLVYLVVLLRIYDVRGPCLDTIEVLARRTGLNKRRILEALKPLFQSGKLEREGDGIHNAFAREMIAAGDEIHGGRQRAGQKGGMRAAQNRKVLQRTGASKAVRSVQESDLEEDSLFPDGNRPPAAEAKAEEQQDVRMTLFRKGLDVAKKITGLSESRARALLGRWLKDARDDALRVLRVIEDAERERVADPVAWITRALGARNGVPEMRSGAAAALIKRRAEEARDVTTLEHAGALPTRTSR